MPKRRWLCPVDAGESYSISRGGSSKVVIFRGRMPHKSADPAAPSTGEVEPVHGTGGLGCRRPKPGGCQLSAVRRKIGGDGAGGACWSVRRYRASIGDKVRRELPDSDLVRRIWNSVRGLRDVHGVSEEAMANIVPKKLAGQSL